VSRILLVVSEQASVVLAALGGAVAGGRRQVPVRCRRLRGREWAPGSRGACRAVAGGA